MKKLALLPALVLTIACADANKLGTVQPAQAPNVMKVTVGSCGASTYINEPCVTVVICVPGTTNCQTIPNVLLDTGSYGLRLFSSVVTLPLPYLTTGGKPVAECTQFGSGSEWGPIKSADVILGGESPVNVPIQIVDSNFATVPTDCTSLDISPAESGYNGILGVGLFVEDCGPGCANITNNRVYFSCDVGGTNTCSSIKWPIAQQVSNPVAFLPKDNNGVIVTLPTVPTNGSRSISGTLTLGIGTQSNNSPGNVTFFPADGNGNFITVFNGSTLTTSFIDSGSNGLFFPAPAGLPACNASGSAAGFYCPATTTSYTALQQGATGTNSKSISFQVINAESTLATGNGVFNNLAGSFGNNFDWGLPFFLGRTVYVGIENKTSTLGTGPYWAH